MSTTYYLSISGGADVLLVDSGGTILAYQAGSTEGPGGTTTYTISPVFDTALFDMPTDVQVWYSNDGTNFAYAPDWITGERSGDTITVEVTETTTVTAKLYYSNGTVVTDENDNSVASVSAELVAGSGVAPTLTASGNTETAAETGAVLTVTASATGSPTPTITYVWKADETDDGTFGTTIAGATSASYTVDAAYDGHDIRCEVTASNGVSPDATAVIDWAKATAYVNIMSFSTTVADSSTDTTESGINSTSLVSDIGWQGRGGNGIAGIIAFAGLDPDKLRVYVSNGETVANTQAVFTDYELVKASDGSVVAAFDILGAGGFDQMDFSQTGNNLVFEPDTDYLLRGIRV